jgi:hypothetical protein
MLPSTTKESVGCMSDWRRDQGQVVTECGVLGRMLKCWVGTEVLD